MNAIQGTTPAVLEEHLLRCQQTALGQCSPFLKENRTSPALLGGQQGPEQPHIRKPSAHAPPEGSNPPPQLPSAGLPAGQLSVAGLDHPLLACWICGHLQHCQRIALNSITESESENAVSFCTEIVQKDPSDTTTWKRAPSARGRISP